jgi:hypothetical protein
VWVNNALLAWRKNYFFVTLEDKQGREKLDKRMGRLRAYMEAHMAPLNEHIGEGLLDPSEAVYILLAETTMMIGTKLAGASKFPAYQDLSARLLDDPSVPEYAEEKGGE